MKEKERNVRRLCEWERRAPRTHTHTRTHTNTRWGLTMRVHTHLLQLEEGIFNLTSCSVCVCVCVAGMDKVGDEGKGRKSIGKQIDKKRIERLLKSINRN